MRHLVSEGAIEGIEINKLTQLQSCYSCEYAKATWKPIKKVHETPCASEFGKEIDLDLWEPSPVLMPGKKEYSVSFTDDHTQWTYVELLHTKDEAFDAYTDFEVWVKTQFRVRSFKRFQTDCGGEYLSHKFNQHLAANGTKQILPCTTLPCIMEWLKGSTVYSWNAPGHSSLKCASQISLGRSSQTHHLVKEQNGNSCTPK